MTDPSPAEQSPAASRQAQPAPYSAATPAEALRAPAGTDPNTLWIWLIVLIPVAQALPLLFINWGDFVTGLLSDPSGLGAYAFMLSPAYLALVAFGWIGLGLQIWFAYLDWRELQRRGVPQPFHWAWIFLALVISYAIYAIGRSVVVKRRTGTGLAPMWVTIATLIGGVIIGVWLSVVIVQMVVEAAMMMSFAP